MARARNIKPSFFTNEILGTLDPIIGMTFIGLWCLADKQGILEDRPLRIKAELFPYREGLDVNGYLTDLERNGFVQRYVVDGVGYIQIINFSKHQHPHHTEKAKGFPQPQPILSEQALTPLSNGYAPSDSLIPDSLIPDSLIPDSLIPDSLIPEVTAPPASQSAPPKKRQAAKIAQQDETELQAACRETWAAYGRAFFERYGTGPVRNQAVNAQVKLFVQRLGKTEAPLVIAFYLSHQGQFYVKNMHQFGHALKDAEKLRTEWATNRTITDTQARQADRTAANANSAAEAMRILESQGVS